jgi:hypothetical protein
VIASPSDPIPEAVRVEQNEVRLGAGDRSLQSLEQFVDRGLFQLQLRAQLIPFPPYRRMVLTEVLLQP